MLHTESLAVLSHKGSGRELPIPGRFEAGRPGSIPRDGGEVVLKQAEWQREIETLDQKEMELHQSQLRLIREQTAIFIHDLAVLQQEVSALRGSHSRRLEALEDVTGESGQKRSQEWVDAQDRLESLHGRLASHHSLLHEREAQHLALQSRVEELQRLAGDMEETKASHGRLVQDVRAREMDHASITQRLDYLERMLGDSADKHAQGLKVHQEQLDKLPGQLREDSRVSLPAVAERLALVEKALGDCFGRGSRELQERLDNLEQSLGENVNRHTRELEAVKVANGKLSSDSKAHETQHSSLTQRIDFLEKAHSRMGDPHQQSLQHASLQERVTFLEKLLGDSAEQHSQGLAGALAEMDRMHGRLTACESSTAQHTSLQERFTYLEKLLGESTEQHSKRLAAALAEVEHMRGRLATCEASVVDATALDQEHSAVAGRLGRVEGLLASSADKNAQDFADVAAKLDQLCNRCSACEHQGSAIDGLVKAHSNLANDRAARDAHHAALAERLRNLEAMLGDSVSKQSRDLEWARASHAKLSDETQAHRASMAERLDAMEVALAGSGLGAGKHALLQDRVGFLERALGESADQHSRELESLKLSHGQLAKQVTSRDASNSSMAERFRHFERALEEVSGTRLRELQAKHDLLCERLTSWETTAARLSDGTWERKLNEADKHHSLVKDRMDFLEGTVRNHADFHKRELETLKGAHTKLHSEAKAQQAHHVSLLDRVDFVERLFGESQERHSQEFQAVHGRFEQLLNQLALCEERCKSIDDLKKSHGSLTTDRAARDAHHAFMSERLDALEQHVGSASNRLAEARGGRPVPLADRVDFLEELLGGVEEGRSEEVKARDAHYASVAERLNLIENLLGDSDEKHGQALQAHHAAVAQRLDYLERVLGDPVSKALRANADAALPATEQEGVPQSAVEERLRFTEALLRETGEKLADVRERLGVEAQLRAQHHESVAEHLAREQQAREGHEKTVQGHFINERKAREAHESLMQELLGHEKVARDKHFGHIQEQLAREREAREKHQEVHQEQFKRHRTIAETAHADLFDMIQKEKGLREQLHQTHQDTLQRERVARGGVEEFLAQERAERARSHQSTTERMDSLQRTMGIFDCLIRKEMEERAKETRRLWDAMDTHTHDLSAQVVTEGNGKREVQEAPEVTPQPRMVRAASATPPVYPMASSVGTAHLQHPPLMLEPSVVVMPPHKLPPPPAAVRVQSPLPSPLPNPTRTPPVPSPLTMTRPLSPHQMQSDLDHHVERMERINCGQTRYFGERQLAAEVIMD